MWRSTSRPQYGQLSAEQYLSPRDVPESVFYDLGLTASYEVDLFGRIRRGIEAANAEDEAAVAARDLVRVTVVASVTGAYTDYCSAGEELASAKRTLALERHRLVYVRHLFTAGRSTSLDVTQLEGDVAQTESTIPVFEASRRDALFLIATLTSRPPETPVSPSPTAAMQACCACPFP